MRRIGLLLGIAGGIVVLAVAGIWAIANPNRHRAMIQVQLERQLGRSVSLGDMNLGIFPLRFQVSNPVIAEDPAIAQQQPFVRAEKLDIQVGWLALLRGKLQIDSVELRRPNVELVRTRNGVWNFSTLGPPATAGPAPNTTNGAAGEFTLGKLTILDGNLAITDLQQNHSRAGYDHIDLTLLDYTAGKPFSFNLVAHVQGTGAQELRLKGEGGPMSRDPANTPFRGTLKLAEVGIDGLLKFFNTGALTSAGGMLSGESEISSQSGKIAATGKLKLDGARFNGLDIGYPIALDYKAAALVADGLVTIDNATLQLGQTPVSVSGTLNTARTVPEMDLKIKSGDVSIAEIARLASAFGVAFAPGTSVNGRISGDVHAKGPFAKPVVTGQIAGRGLKISGQGIPQAVAVNAVDLALSPTAIRSNEFSVTSGKTTALAQFSVLQYASNSPSIDAGLRAPNATLPEIQSIAKAYGVTGLDQITGQGSLNLDLHAKGSLQSLSTTAATRALNGVINLDFSPLRIAGFDTAHELEKLGGFASSQGEGNATDILHVVGRILVKDGVAQTDDLRLQLGIGNLSAAGTADLTSEALNLKLTTVFSKAFSDKVANTRGGGFLNTALTNSAGELVLPAIVTGSFARPMFTPDLKAVAQLQKQKYLPTLDNPATAVGNVLGALTGKTNASPQQPAGEKPSVLKGILDVFGGTKADPAKK